VITCKASDTLAAAAWLMGDHDCGILPAVGPDGRVAGVITEPVVDENDHPVSMISLSDLAIECARTDTEMKHGPSKIAHTLAAISRPRTRSQEVA